MVTSLLVPQNCWSSVSSEREVFTHVPTGAGIGPVIRPRESPQLKLSFEKWSVQVKKKLVFRWHSPFAVSCFFFLFFVCTVNLIIIMP